MERLIRIGFAVLLLSVAACGERSAATLSTPPGIESETQVAPNDSPALIDYLDLPTDALTSDRIAWQQALDTARNQMLSDTAGGAEYLVNIPNGWFNADENVFVYVWRRQDDRRITTGTPDQGYLVVVAASDGNILAAGPFQR